MQYTVEVRLIGGDLLTAMSEMRTWLDHKHSEPDAFRCSRGSPITTVRLDFKSAGEASEFAAAFAGRVLGSPAVAMPHAAPLVLDALPEESRGG